MFKIAAIIISVAVLIASICCGSACLILVIKRYKGFKLTLIELKKHAKDNISLLFLSTKHVSC